MFLRSLSPHQRYPSYFHVVVGLVWANGPDSYAGGIVTTVMASNGEQVKGDDPD
jgi:hypothetical protein